MTSADVMLNELENTVNTSVVVEVTTGELLAITEALKNEYDNMSDRRELANKYLKLWNRLCKVLDEAYAE